MKPISDIPFERVGNIISTKILMGFPYGEQFGWQFIEQNMSDADFKKKVCDSMIREFTRLSTVAESIASDTLDGSVIKKG